jgi:hypothetical protein
VSAHISGARVHVRARAARARVRRAAHSAAHAHTRSARGAHARAVCEHERAHPRAPLTLRPHLGRDAHTRRHNQRIERWWGDLSPYTSPIAACLNEFETNGHLNLAFVSHRVAVLLVFLPYVNIVLDYVRSAWNAHRVSTRGMRCQPREYFERGRALNRDNGTEQLLFVDAAGNVVPPPGSFASALHAAAALGAAGPAAAGGAAWLPAAQLAVAQPLDLQQRVQFLWLTPLLRAHLCSHLRPLVRGEGMLYVEALTRFQRAERLIVALHGRSVLSGIVLPSDVDELVAAGF